MKIQLLGVHTAFFEELRQRLQRLSGQLGLLADVEEVKDIDTILRLKAKYIPAIAIDGKVILSYRDPSDYNETELLDVLQWVQSSEKQGNHPTPHFDA